MGTAQTSTGDAILAMVNDQSIPEIELKWEIGQLTAEMSLRNRPLSTGQIRTLQPQLTDNIIERELLYQYASQKKIGVRTQLVNDTLADLKEQLGGNSALNHYLRTTGMSRSQLKEKLHKGLIVRHLLRKEAIRAIKVSEAEMQAFYRQNQEFFETGEQIRSRHILIAVSNMHNETQRAESWEKIQALKTRLENGADFAVLALEYSDCPSRISAGDLGYLSREQMIPSFADVVFQLQPGQVSNVFATRFGYHIVKVVDRRPASRLSFKEARPKIERTIRRNKENEAVKSLIAQLKSQAVIKKD